MVVPISREISSSTWLILTKKIVLLANSKKRRTSTIVHVAAAANQQDSSRRRCDHRLRSLPPTLTLEFDVQEFQHQDAANGNNEHGSWEG